MTADLLRGIGLFSHLEDDDLERLAARTEQVRLVKGETLFEEGDPGERAYVILEGEVEVVKRSGDRGVRLAVRGPGEVIGEIALLQEVPRIATVRALGDVMLLSLRKAELDWLVGSSASAARAMFSTLLDRWRETQEQLRQVERMAQLGTLTAGVAHELNNPSAAAKRAADELGGVLGLLADAAHRLAGLGLPAVASDLLARLSARAERSATDPGLLDPLARADLEAAVEERMEALGVPEPWRLAPDWVEAGLGTAELSEVEGAAPAEAAGPAVELVAATFRVRRLAYEMGEAAGRLSGIVGALKTYSYLDQAPVQEVDVVRGIEDTLMLLAHKLRGVEVVRDYHAELPRITAYGSELNQVWTNLIDNAADAVAGAEGGRISVRAEPFHGGVAVEVEDNGPGIPEEVGLRVFDAFYTTKPPGRGTGLGLSTSHRIVAQRHGGRLGFTSRPGRTVFRVELPPLGEDVGTKG